MAEQKLEAQTSSGLFHNSKPFRVIGAHPKEKSGAFHDAVCGGPYTVDHLGTGTDYSLSVAEGSSGTATVAAGGTATYNVVLSPDLFEGPVSLSCNGAPTRSNCTVSPTSVNLDGTNDGTATVTVTTTARSMLPPPGTVPSPPWWLWALMLGLLVGFVLLTEQKVLPRRIGIGFATAVLFGLLWTGCGGDGAVPPPPGGSTGTPAGTYSLTVSATSGEAVRTLPLTLTVN